MVKRVFGKTDWLSPRENHGRIHADALRRHDRRTKVPSPECLESRGKEYNGNIACICVAWRDRGIHVSVKRYNRRRDYRVLVSYRNTRSRCASRRATQGDQGNFGTADAITATQGRPDFSLKLSSRCPETRSWSSWFIFERHGVTPVAGPVVARQLLGGNRCEEGHS